MAIKQNEDDSSGFEEENDDEGSDEDESESYDDDSSENEDDEGLEFDVELYDKHHLSDSEIIHGERVNLQNNGQSKILRGIQLNRKEWTLWIKVRMKWEKKKRKVY